MSAWATGSGGGPAVPRPCVDEVDGQVITEAEAARLAAEFEAEMDEDAEADAAPIAAAADDAAAAAPDAATAVLDAEVWVDGGHNVSAGLALAKHFADYEAGSIDLIIGMLANKDPSAIITPLHEKLASVTVVPVPDHDSHTVADYPDVDAPVSEVANIFDALQKQKPAHGKTVLIAGSLYLAGEVLRANEQVPD